MSRATRFVLLLALVHGLVHLSLFAPWMGEDEPWHVEHASYVQQGHLPGLGRGVELTHADLEHHPLTQLLAKRRFPSLSYAEIETTQRLILEDMERSGFWRRVDWAPPNSAARVFDEIQPGFTAVNQPPLYYLVLGNLAKPFGAGPRTILWVGRALSLLFYVATVGLSWRLARSAFDDEPCALAVVLVVLLVPIHTRQAALVNNDVLATLWSALLLAVGAQVLERLEALPGPGRVRPALLVVALAALAVLTKMTAAGVSALVVMVAFTSLVQGRSRISWIPVVGAGGALLAAAVLYWNQQHNPALPREIATYIERVDRGFSLDSLYKLWGRFIGRLNWNSRSLPESVYGATSVGFGVAFASALVSLLRKPRGARRSVVLFCLAAVIAQAALVFLRGVPEGRYLVPALPALGVLVAAGLVAPWRTDRRRAAVAVLAVLLLALDAVYLWRGVALHHYLLWNA